MRSLAKDLTTLVEKVSPADVRLRVPRHAFLRETGGFEVSLLTRGFDECFGGKTIREAVDSALYDVENPPEGSGDPFVPSWLRLSRMQRELVEHTLRRLAEKHMARAAAANIGAGPKAQADYAMADAFRAALDALAFDDTDDHSAPLEHEPLEARTASADSVTTKEQEVERNDFRSRKERRAALSKAVAELKQKNREQARSGRKP